MRRAILAFAALIALSQTAMAGVPLFGHVSCAVVRFYVAKYSEATAEKWARSHGASETEIETARHCLHHSVDVQTASLAPKLQAVAPVVAPAAEPVGTANKPDDRNPDQSALQVSVEGPRVDPEQDSHDAKPGVDGVVRPKEIDDQPTKQASDETRHDLVPSDAKTGPSRSGNVARIHRAYNAGATRHVSWLKRLWDHLTRRPRFSVAMLHFGGSRRW